MSVESDAKIYLQNRLIKCRSKLLEIEPIRDTKGTLCLVLYR